MDNPEVHVLLVQGRKVRYSNNHSLSNIFFLVFFSYQRNSKENNAWQKEWSLIRNKPSACSKLITQWIWGFSWRWPRKHPWLKTRVRYSAKTSLLPLVLPWEITRILRSVTPWTSTCFKKGGGTGSIAHIFIIFNYGQRGCSKPKGEKDEKD